MCVCVYGVIPCCDGGCSGETPALYTVIPEKTVPVGGAMMGSSHVYDVSTASAPAKKVREGGEGVGGEGKGVG